MSAIQSMKEYLKKFEDNDITDYNNPNCNDCNECCGMLTLVTMEEYGRLTNYLKTEEGKKIVQRAKNKKKKYYRKNTIYLLCPFSDLEKKCLIYDIRPTMCREFHCMTSCHRNNEKVRDGIMAKEHKTLYDLFL